MLFLRYDSKIFSINLFMRLIHIPINNFSSNKTFITGIEPNLYNVI